MEHPLDPHFRDIFINLSTGANSILGDALALGAESTMCYEPPRAIIEENVLCHL